MGGGCPLLLNLVRGTKRYNQQARPEHPAGVAPRRAFSPKDGKAYLFLGNDPYSSLLRIDSPLISIR